MKTHLTLPSDPLKEGSVSRAPLSTLLERRTAEEARPRKWATKVRASFSSLFVLVGLLAWSAPSHAEEPVTPTEPSVLRETAVDLLQLASSFDKDDPFDLNLRLGFDHQSRQTAVRRETNIRGATSGGYTSDLLDVATYRQSTQRLIPELAIGLFRDVQLSVRMPVILADNRRLEERGSSGSQPLATMGLAGEQLFSPNFESPTRSGIEYLAVGLDLALMNQSRKPARPTWIMGIEGRFNVSEPMHACTTAPKEGQVECAYEADINRNGENDPLSGNFGALAGENEGSFSGSRKPGVSRGTTGLEAHAFVSRRLKYIEPYSGVSALFEFQGKNTAYGPFNLEGSLVNHPPLRGSVIVGLAVIPWEQTEKFRRILLDFRVKGTYVSEGRDYSELFDALGSSDAKSLRNPQYNDYTLNRDVGSVADHPSIVDTDGQRVNFTGLTDVQQYGDYELRGQLTWQASKFVKFDMGAAWRIIQEHFITHDQACNPDVTNQLVRSGPCKQPDSLQAGESGVAWKAGGLPNPHHRKVINEPGQRFKVETSNGVRAWFRASVMF